MAVRAAGSGSGPGPAEPGYADARARKGGPGVGRIPLTGGSAGSELRGAPREPGGWLGSRLNRPRCWLCRWRAGWLLGSLWTRRTCVYVGAGTGVGQERC